MPVPVQEAASGIREGVAVGFGTIIASAVAGVFASWGFMKKRVAKVHAKVIVLETQAEKDKSFKRMVIESQMTQMDLFQLLIDRNAISCEDCPTVKAMTKDSRTQEIVDQAKEKLTGYLGGLA